MYALKNRLCFAATFLLFLSANFSAAQENFERVDAVIQLYPKRAASVEQIAGFINRDFSSEADKLRAIYGWLINNIAYDPNEYKALDYSFTTVSERNKKQEKFRQQLINRVIEKGVAVCEGYAFVFERLCELTGVTSYLVRGDSKASLADIGRKFDVNHMWNIALIDGNTYLFDATWGAGRYTDRFEKDTTYSFFMADPQQFVYTHLPLLEEDQLLTQPLSRAIFESMPIIVDDSLKEYKSLLPATGILNSGASSGKWQFRLPIPQQSAIGISVDGSAVKSQNTHWNAEAQLHEFELDIPLGAQLLIIYFDERPGMVYKID
ncbi:transglutaminase domain-containing protein [Gilvibacter sediminis]|uniref:transglutaminase domain-containing protein n=1 Tax=Gilvibacter sediminis TaxID=379071 RepID=UPI0023509C6D|nr:hypothetical protein [Gilvibacter sediminis]MDC7997278.1 hypothetical protein [Gilvibacter sediminis]